MAYDDDVDEEELQLDYEEKCNDVVELQAEVRAAKIEAQQLRLRLQAASKSGAGVGGAVNGGVLGLPTAVVTPCAPSSNDQRVEELSRMISWLSEHVVLDQHPPEILEVGFEVPISGRTVHLQRVRQWPLTAPASSQLRLSVPVHHQESIGALLAAAKARGNVLDNQTLRSFAACWDLVPGELTTATHARAEPAVLLAHRSSMDGVLIATWPTKDALEAFRALHATNGETPAVGSRVEVEYDGKWYAGFLSSIDAAGNATVQCDVDEPGVVTVAPLHRVKRLPAAGANGNNSTANSHVFAEATDAGPTPAANTSAPANATERAKLLRERLLSEETENSCNGGTSRPGNHRRTRSAT